LLIGLILLALPSCAVYGGKQEYPMLQPPKLTDTHFVTPDGQDLPLRRFSVTKPKAIVIAAHGFNDYRMSFEGIGQFFADQKIQLIAYDQRGFGGNVKPGRWAGEEILVQDLIYLARTVREDNPNTPLYIMGDSMGGAVAIVASTQTRLPIDGLILIAPAVWARGTMNPLQTFALWFTAHTMPWLQLDGKGLGIKPSDNKEMLRELSKDPLVIKEARPDTLYGLTNLMDSAFEQSAFLTTPTLILYGGNDQIIPKYPTCQMLQKLPAAPKGNWQFVMYPNGYHMLLRDLTARTYWQDIALWMDNPKNKLSEDSEVLTARDTERRPAFCKKWF
jgi:alpha-beta hydrolase superfamily lysophospholipase